MNYDIGLVAGKLRRWDKYVQDYKLPAWEELPDIGLYMEQVVSLLRSYLDYLPPELKEEEFVTAATINNYVRKRIMPEPVKKRYYREHLAYLIIICTLKQSLSIATLSTMLPPDISKEQLKDIYSLYIRTHRSASLYFCEQAKQASLRMLGQEASGDGYTANTPEQLIISTAVISNYAKLLAEKLLLIEGKTLLDGGEVG